MFKIYFYVKTHKHIHKEAKLTIYSQHNDKSLSCNFSDTSCAELDIIPQHGEGKSHKEAKGSAKVRDEGLKRIDEVLLQNRCADCPIGYDNAKGVEVFVINFLHRILVVGARQEAPCALLNVLLVPCCQA